MSILKDKKKLKSIVESSYNEGFVPNRPSTLIDELLFESVSLKSIDSIQKNIKNINQSLQSRTGDENFIELIDNDDFASVLNSSLEIIVDDIFYKYTTDGLFFVEATNQSLLNDFLIERENQLNPQAYSSGLTNINNDINVYIPDVSQMDSYKILPPTNQDIDYHNTISGSGNTNPINPLNLNPDLVYTNHYSVCVNTLGSWVDNIFGKYYRCECLFTNRRKLVTSFSVADYYLFSDVYAQTKFKKKDDLDFWWAARDATTSYLKIHNASIGITNKDINFNVVVSQNDIINAWNEIRYMFVNSSNKKATFISQIFNRNGTQQEYTPVLDELTTAANSISIDPIFVPAAQITKSLLEFNFNEFFSPLTNKIIVVTIMGEEASITNTDVFKAIVKAYKDFGNTGNSGVGVMVISKPTNSSIQSGKILAYSAANELHQTFGYSIINRNFKIPSGFNLKEITLGYSTNGTSSSSKFKIKIAISRKAVSNYNVFIEGGALYNGIWGGSKLLAVKI